MSGEHGKSLRQADDSIERPDSGVLDSSAERKRTRLEGSDVVNKSKKTRVEEEQEEYAEDELTLGPGKPTLSDDMIQIIPHFFHHTAVAVRENSNGPFPPAPAFTRERAVSKTRDRLPSDIPESGGEANATPRSSSPITSQQQSIETTRFDGSTNSSRSTRSGNSENSSRFNAGDAGRSEEPDSEVGYV